MPAMASTCLGSTIRLWIWWEWFSTAPRGVAIGADAKGVLAVDFKQVGGLIKNIGDGLVVQDVVHEDKDKQESSEDSQMTDQLTTSDLAARPLSVTFAIQSIIVVNI